MGSLLGISVIKTSVVSTKAAIDAAFSIALIVTLKQERVTVGKKGEGGKG
jgi:hypothetical protein